MSRLPNIPVVAETPGGKSSEWGNALPVLHEIRHALERFAKSGERTVIDLRSMPFGPGDEERLLSALGRGEVEATISALGPTRVWETACSGVWLVDHRNADDERLLLQVEIAAVPDILQAQHQDVLDGLAVLDARIGRSPQEADS